MSVGPRRDASPLVPPLPLSSSLSVGAESKISTEIKSAYSSSLPRPHPRDQLRLFELYPPHLVHTSDTHRDLLSELERQRDSRGIDTSRSGMSQEQGGESHRNVVPGPKPPSSASRSTTSAAVRYFDPSRVRARQQQHGFRSRNGFSSRYEHGDENGGKSLEMQTPRSRESRVRTSLARSANSLVVKQPRQIPQELAAPFSAASGSHSRVSAFQSSRKNRIFRKKQTVTLKSRDGTTLASAEMISPRVDPFISVDDVDDDCSFGSSAVNDDHESPVSPRTLGLDDNKKRYFDTGPQLSPSSGVFDTARLLFRTLSMRLEHERIAPAREDSSPQQSHSNAEASYPLQELNDNRQLADSTDHQSLNARRSQSSLRSLHSSQKEIKQNSGPSFSDHAMMECLPTDVANLYRLFSRKLVEQQRAMEFRLREAVRREREKYVIGGEVEQLRSRNQFLEKQHVQFKSLLRKVQDLERENAFLYEKAQRSISQNVSEREKIDQQLKEMEIALLDIRTTPAGVRVLLEEEVERLSGALRYALREIETEKANRFEAEERYRELEEWVYLLDPSLGSADENVLAAQNSSRPISPSDHHDSRPPSRSLLRSELSNPPLHSESVSDHASKASPSNISFSSSSSSSRSSRSSLSQAISPAPCDPSPTCKKDEAVVDDSRLESPSSLPCPSVAPPFSF